MFANRQLACLYERKEILLRQSALNRESLKGDLESHLDFIATVDLGIETVRKVREVSSLTGLTWLFFR